MSAGSQTEIVMPRMGLTMEEGTVVAWLKEVGQTVKAGEPLVEIETDKATVQIEAPASGILQQITGKPGDTLPVGAVIAYLAAEGAVESTPAPIVLDKVRASPAARRMARTLQVELSQVKGSGPGGRVVAWNVQEIAAQRAPSSPVAIETSQKATPLAQRVAQELQLDLAQVQGSGPGGRVTRRDIERSIASPHPQPGGPPPGYTLEPLGRVQKRMAERMTSSFQSAPHFYLHSEVDCRSLLALRLSLLPRLEQRFGMHLTITDLMIKFCALSLKQNPSVLSQWSEDGLLHTDAVNIGVAADTPQGLVVPVIHGCDQLGLSEIAQRRAELVEKARQGRLAPEELELGTFTISNLGMYRIDFFDAVLNPPQAAILAIGQIKKRPVVENEHIIPADCMTLSLSIDHRVLDGVKAARFLSDLVELIETPGLSLG